MKEDMTTASHQAPAAESAGGDGYNFAYLDEGAKRMIRRADLTYIPKDVSNTVLIQGGTGNGIYIFATVPEDKLASIRSLEAEIRAPLLAMAQVDVAPARLDRERLARIEQLEDELGVVLVAVRGDDEPSDGQRRRRRRGA